MGKRKIIPENEQVGVQDSLNKGEMKSRSHLEVLKTNHAQEEVYHFNQNIQEITKKLSIMIHNLLHKQQTEKSGYF